MEFWQILGYLSALAVLIAFPFLVGSHRFQRMHLATRRRDAAAASLYAFGYGLLVAYIATGALHLAAGPYEMGIVLLGGAFWAFYLSWRRQNVADSATRKSDVTRMDIQ